MTGQPTPDAETPARSKASDATVLAVTALVVILAGLAIAFGIRWVSGGGETADEAAGKECPAVAPLGVARMLRADPDLEVIPQYRLLGRECDLWLTKVDGQIVAVKGAQDAMGCTIKPDAVTEVWECNGVEVAYEDLDQWPLEVRTVNGEPGILVALLAETA